MAQALDGFGDVLNRLGAQRLGSYFSYLVGAFERAEAPEKRRRLAECELSYFSEANGLNDLFITRKVEPDEETTQDVEPYRIMIRELLNVIYDMPISSGRRFGALIPEARYGSSAPSLVILCELFDETLMRCAHA